VLTLIAVHGLAVAALAVAVGWTHEKPRPCRKTFERVRVGMTRAEVEATVGGPPGDFSSADWVSRPFRIPGGEAVWIYDEVELNVWYADDGRVSKVSVGPSFCFRQPSRWERVWEWVTTGHDSPSYFFSRRVVSPYDLDTLRGILAP